MGHLHLDHAGGLGLFKDLGTPIWVHEKELKNALYSVATGADLGCVRLSVLFFKGR